MTTTDKPALDSPTDCPTQQPRSPGLRGLKDVDADPISFGLRQAIAYSDQGQAATDYLTARSELGLVRLQSDCPNRPLDWRWQRAGRMLDLGLRWSRRRDDPSIRQAKRFRSSWIRHPHNDSRARLAARMPELAAALAIRLDNSRLRRAVEGRLLAGLDSGPIAAEMGLLRGAVTLFEQLFFNVADRLGCRAYILHMAIRSGRIAPGPPDADSLARFFSYFGGLRALSTLENSPTFTSMCAGQAPEMAIGSSPTSDPVGLAIRAISLDLDSGSPLESKMMLRLAESERRYRSKEVGSGLVRAVSAAGLTDPLDLLATAIKAGGGAVCDVGPKASRVADSGVIPAVEEVEDQREGEGATEPESAGSVPAWGLVA